MPHKIMTIKEVDAKYPTLAIGNRAVEREISYAALIAGIEKLRPTPGLTELEVHPLYKPARRISDAPILYQGPEGSYLEDENIGGW